MLGQFAGLSGARPQCSSLGQTLIFWEGFRKRYDQKAWSSIPWKAFWNYWNHHWTHLCTVSTGKENYNLSQHDFKNCNSGTQHVKLNNTKKNRNCKMKQITQTFCLRNDHLGLELLSRQPSPQALKYFWIRLRYIHNKWNYKRIMSSAENESQSSERYVLHVKGSICLAAMRSVYCCGSQFCKTKCIMHCSPTIMLLLRSILSDLWIWHNVFREMVKVVH